MTQKGKTPLIEKVIVYKNRPPPPPPKDKTGSQKLDLQNIKLEKFTDV